MIERTGFNIKDYFTRRNNLNRKYVASYFFLFFSLLIFNSALCLAIEEGENLPYLYQSIVPKSTSLNFQENLQIDLFTGSAVFPYTLNTPLGTNNLQPEITLYYSSSNVGKWSDFLGSGWEMSQNYIQRDTNYTFSNTSDDRFNLILDGFLYKLVYSSVEGRYHTERESFLFIKNQSGAHNVKGIYWILKTKDGTTYRFGFLNNSEKISNTYDYTWRWSLDLVNDTYGNSLFYNYTEDTYIGDLGTIYPDTIEYNNDKIRKIKFMFEASNRPDIWGIYNNGNKIKQNRRLKEIQMFYNKSLIRKYALEYNTFTNQRTLSFLSNITEIGSDNITKLSPVFFNYQSTLNGWTQQDSFEPPQCYVSDTASTGKDRGYRLIDINRDGFVDILYGREQPDGQCTSSERTAYINNGTGWNQDDGWEPPRCFITNSGKDAGVRETDLNADGFIDMLFGWEIAASPACGDNEKRAYINNGTGWNQDDGWEPPDCFATNSASNSKDLGYRIIDINGDLLPDILYGKETTASACTISERTAYINNGGGWNQDDTFQPPICFVKHENNGASDRGYRLADLNGDGLVDLLYGRKESDGSCDSAGKTAYINNGTGWNQDDGWEPSLCFVSDSGLIDHGVRLADINGDGMVDLSYGQEIGGSICGTAEKSAYLNNAQKTYLLRNITTSFGGKISVDYIKSTESSNKGNDTINDLGFNMWVVSNITEDNGVNGSHNVVVITHYNYSNGSYDYEDKEFRGFNYVVERTTNKLIKHRFYQDNTRRGLEYLTEIFDNLDNIYKKVEKVLNVTQKNSYRLVEIIEESESTYDGVLNSPKIKNTTYRYDNFGNVILIHHKGDVADLTDDRYEYFNYLNNSNAWIVNKVKNYSLFNSSNTGKIRETLYSYDNLAYGTTPTKGSLTKEELWLNTSGNPIALYGYNNLGNLINKTDPNNRTTKFIYGIRDTTNTSIDRIVNAKNHIIDYWHDLGTGNILSEFDSNRVARNYSYDVFGRKLKEILPYDNSTYPTISYEYTFDGMAPEKIKIIKRETNLTSNTLDEYQFYDGFGRYVQTKLEGDNSKLLVTDVFYDNEGRLQRQSNPYLTSFNENYTSPNQSIYTTNYTYDVLDRLIKLTNPDSTFRNITYNHWNSTLYDENAHRKDYQINAFNNILKVTEYISGITYITRYSYDSADLLISVFDSKNNNINYTYDSLGRKILMNDFDLGLWNYSYDSAGNLIKQIDGRNNTLTIQYDQLNRKTKEIGTSVNRSYFYDIKLNNTLSRAEIGSSIIINYTYDNRLRKIKEDKSIDNLLFVTQWNYDSLNRVTVKTLPDKKTISYSYSNRGLVKSMGDVINITYNERNELLGIFYFNLLTSNYTYKSNNLRLMQIKTDTKQDLNYDYDNVGNVRSINDTANSKIYSMSYDDLDRLIFTKIIDNANQKNHTLNFVYDSIGNILEVLFNNTNYTYYYANRPIHSPNRILQTFYNNTIPVIGLTLISPLNIASVINVTKGLFFNITVNVSCKNVNCGQINISFDPSQDTGFKSPLTVIDDSSFGTFAWTSVNNAKTSDNAYAISSTSSLAPTHYLKVTNFSFGIPSDATIDGVEVQIEHLGDFVNEIEDEVVKIVKGGVVSGNNKASLTDWAITEETFTYGGASDLWGVALTPTDVNAQNFGVVLSADIIAGGGFNDVKVDHIKMKVYYTTSTGKGLISTIISTIPFYINQSNPRNITLNAGQSQIVTAFVNATGNLGANYTFFVYANRTSDMAISNITNKWNVSIVDAVSNQSQQQTNTSLKSPGTVQSNNSAGSFAWTSVDNAKTSNNLYTLAQSTVLGSTHYLRVTNFSFNLPPSATIRGVEAKVEVLGDFTDEIRDFEAKLLKAGVVSGTDHKNTTSWPLVDQIRTYGNSTDIWGITLNSSDVNAVNFGIAFRAEVYAGGGFNDINVDHVQMKIYYSV